MQASLVEHISDSVADLRIALRNLTRNRRRSLTALLIVAVGVISMVTYLRSPETVGVTVKVRPDMMVPIWGGRPITPMPLMPWPPTGN